MKTKCRLWIGSRPNVVCQAYKKYLVLQPWQIAVRIDFRFETVWCILESNSLLCKDGSLLPITHVYINGKCLIGKDDPYQIGLDYNEDARAFRNALDARNVEKANQS